MRLRASLVCEDVRFEVGGKLTAVGIGARIEAEPGDGPLIVPRLAFLAVVGDLRGQGEVAYRHYVVPAGAHDHEPPPLSREAHDPAQDEHTFVLALAPLVLDDGGWYECVLEVESEVARLRDQRRFEVRRGDLGGSPSPALTSPPGG